MSALPPNTLDRPKSFTFGSWEIGEAAGEVRFHYSFDGKFDFIETINFGSPLPEEGTPLRNGFSCALEALSIALGVSYYKAFVPPNMLLCGVNLSRGQRKFFQNLYINGLGEFGHRNNLKLEQIISFEDAKTADGAAPPTHPSKSPQNLTRRSAVLIGGGKDSIVALEVLKSSSEPMVLLSVNPKRPMLECGAASGIPLISITRRIDPALLALNAKGAFNGHIPITAIISLIAAAAAFVYDYDAIVLSNERSADEGNIRVDGRELNHQFSKTSAFEHQLQQYISEYIAPELKYFSLLRPLSELKIAQLMARTTLYDQCVTSCPSSFRMDNDTANQRWCRDCPKCRFAFLVLASAMPPERLSAIFGGNVFQDETQIDGFEELLGLSGHKPWECVGELMESQAALLHLAADPKWGQSAVVKSLAPRVRILLQDPERVLIEQLKPSTSHHLPDGYWELLNAYIEQS